ncbi:MAG: 4'-phosphopantetheinyl transferase superfamily protein [Gammaproteobacteria bacterium]|nr:4'-phosphopantetheinyl transferase superfamily protein [Gammaproteobacteria bacterium]
MALARIPADDFHGSTHPATGEMPAPPHASAVGETPFHCEGHPRAPGAEGSWWRPIGDAGGAAIVHVDLRPDQRREAEALRSLDQEELARWHRYRHPRPRRQFALCRAVLRRVLCERIGCANQDLRFVSLEHGKPGALAGEEPVRASFNVSHGGDHGLVALAPRGRLGVDVEERSLRHDPDGHIRKVFAPREQEALAAARGKRKTWMFFRLWTLKEAVIKALGTGFSLDTSTFEIPPSMYLSNQRRTIFELPHLPGLRWRLEDLGNREFAAAVALEVPRNPASGPGVP